MANATPRPPGFSIFSPIGIIAYLLTSDLVILSAPFLEPHQRSEKRLYPLVAPRGDFKIRPLICSFVLSSTIVKKVISNLIMMLNKKVIVYN